MLKTLFRHFCRGRITSIGKSLNLIEIEILSPLYWKQIFGAPKNLLTVSSFATFMCFNYFLVQYLAYLASWRSFWKTETYLVNDDVFLLSFHFLLTILLKNVRKTYDLFLHFRLDSKDQFLNFCFVVTVIKRNSLYTCISAFISFFIVNINNSGNDMQPNFISCYFRNALI